MQKELVWDADDLPAYSGNVSVNPPYAMAVAIRALFIGYRRRIWCGDKAAHHRKRIAETLSIVGV